MERSDSPSSERPAKRVRQACEPCRRKKAKCTGEQPDCSLCLRLGQQCVYAEERRRPRASEGPARPHLEDQSAPQSMADLLREMEGKIGVIYDRLGGSSSVNPPTMTTSQSQSPSGMMQTSGPSPSVVLPPWEEIFPVAELYLLYCESQPLPLFHRESFIASLQTRDIEIIYAILALSLRFSDAHSNAQFYAEQVNGYAEVARGLVMKRVSEGPVEISTLQCLCLLSLVDFTNGNTHRSSIHSSLAMNLAQCANLAIEPRTPDSINYREERRRCFWSICLLKRLHGSDISHEILERVLPAYPQSPARPPQMHSPGATPDDARISEIHDQGILAYVITLSEAFARTGRYVRLRGQPTHAPPWNPISEYSKIMALLMNTETNVPLTHRFKWAGLKDRSTEELQAHRDYWGPWFLNQFMYHTMLCLLNHPLILSQTLRDYRRTIPEIFLQHKSELIATHTKWIIWFIDFFEEKRFYVSDPLLGYCAAVVATIELQSSFTGDSQVREEKRGRFLKCVKFVQQLGERWPHMARLAERLYRLREAVSATYQSDPNAQNPRLLIDLSKFWEILEYSSNSDSNSARRLFGDSLYAAPSIVNREVSQTTPLPAPTRVGEERPGIMQTPGTFDGNAPGVADVLANSLVLPQHFTLTNDDFSISATNFFSQGQEFLKGGDSWTDFGNF